MDIIKKAGITKEYDEMTDITKYFSPVMRVGGSGYFSKIAKSLSQAHISIRIVIGINNGEVFSHLVFGRRGLDWSWISDASTIFLVDGVRTQGEALVGENFTTTNESTVYCNEYVSQETDIDYLRTISKASSVKFRVGRIDIVPPDEFIPNLKELLETTKNLGK